MTNDTLYSTVASINGVWLSLIFSLGLILLTYIIKQNTRFFESQRDEKEKLYSNVIKITSTGFTNFSNTHSDLNAKKRLSTIFWNLKMQYNEPGKSDKTVDIGDIDKIKEMVQHIVYCYPIPEFGITFMHTEKLLIGDKEYEEWVRKYHQRIEFNTVKQSYEIIQYNFELLNNTKILDTSKLSTVNKIISVMESLVGINDSIHQIETLKRDYTPIVNILGQTKWYIVILFFNSFFGIVLPIYMLLPKHFNWFSENIVIDSIFGGLFICYIGAAILIKKIFDSILK